MKTLKELGFLWLLGIWEVIKIFVILASVMVLVPLTLPIWLPIMVAKDKAKWG